MDKGKGPAMTQGCGCHAGPSFNPDLLEEELMRIWVVLHYCPVHWSHVPEEERKQLWLHAAAPALLEACEAAARAINMTLKEELAPYRVAWEGLLRDLRAALALAKGEA